MEENYISKMSIDKIVSLYEIFGNRLLAKRRRAKLERLDFSIISNNCWGGHVYRYFGLPYNSPTVGTYFFAEEYIRFVADIKNNLYLPLMFITAEESKYREYLFHKNQRNVPIGLIGEDIEVVFLHYSSKEEAYEKWNRRTERVNINNLIIKFSEMNLCEKRHLEQFEKLNYQKKLLLLSEEYPKAPSGIVIRRYVKDHQVTNDTLYYSFYTDLCKLING